MSKSRTFVALVAGLLAASCAGTSDEVTLDDKDTGGGGKADDADPSGDRVEIILDHMGRVETNNFMLKTDEARAAFNHEDAFAIGRVLEVERAGDASSLTNEETALLSRLDGYRQAINKGMGELDALDALDFEVDPEELEGFGDIIDRVADWPETHTLRDLMLANYLVVDVSKPCNPYRNGALVEDALDDGVLQLADRDDERNYNIVHSNYFAIELAALFETTHDTCGGRLYDSDTIDYTLTLFINGPERMFDPELVRRDKVERPDKKMTSTFPYIGR